MPPDTNESSSHDLSDAREATGTSPSNARHEAATAAPPEIRELQPAPVGNHSARRLRDQRRLFQSVLSILRANGTRDQNDFLALVTRKVAHALGVDRVGVWLFDDAHDAIHCAHLHSEGRDSQHAPSRAHFTRADHPAYFEAIESTLPVRADDARTHLATRSFRECYLAPLGITSILDTPIRLGGHLAGVLCCEAIGEPRHWTHDEEEFTLAVAAIVLIFLESDRRRAAERNLQELNHRLEGIVEARTAALARSERRLQHLITATPTVIYTCEPSGEYRTTFISPNVEQRFGHAPADFTGDPSFWIDHIHPDDLARVLDAMRESERTGSMQCEYRFRRTDGTFRWVRDTLALLRDDHGAPREMVGSWTDIHDRRTAEAAAITAANDLRRLIDTANAPIFGTDTRHLVTEWNQCAERLTGFSRAEVLGTPLLDRVAASNSSDTPRETVARILDRACGGTETENFELPLVNRDGRTILLLLNASTRRDAAGEITGMVGVGQDITELRAAERRSLRAQRLESIGTLAGGVAHDVNNALAPILLATGLLRKRHPESHDLLDVMESSARRGASMVRQLLTFAKGVDGARVPVPSKSVLREIEHIVSSTFPKSIEARFHCEQDLPTVIGDATQLHQVLLNLCVNARDAMPAGGVLEVDARRAEVSVAEARTHGDGAAGDYILWRVRDTGAGMAPAVVEHIFDPFFSTKSPDQGTGLGLSTALGIVRSHGGFMRVDSAPGHGSTFSVYLPAAASGAGDTAESRDGRRTTFRGHGERILVVDDEPAVREVFREILATLGMQVETAADAETGLALLAQAPGAYSGVLTDLHMPRMDGLAFTREIRRCHGDLPVILSSGRVDKQLATTIADLGILAQLDKPFSIDALSDALQRMLGARR